MRLEERQLARSRAQRLSRTRQKMLTLKGEETASMVPLCKDAVRGVAIRERTAAIQRQALEKLKTMGFKLK